jgi:hypothetical protein
MRLYIETHPERGRKGGVKSIPRQRLVWIYKEKDIMIQM